MDDINMSGVNISGSLNDIIDEHVEERSLIDISKEDEDLSYLINAVDENLAKVLTLSKNEVKELKEFINVSLSGAAGSVPMICTGSDCMYAARCPFTGKSQWPLAKRCPLEFALMKRGFDDYCKSLDVDLADKVERTIIQDLVSTELYEARLNHILGNEGPIVEEMFGINEVDGTPLLRNVENPAWKMLFNCRKRRDVLFNDLAATRRMKARFGKKDIQSYDKRIQDITKRAEKLKKESVEAKIVEVKYTVPNKES